MQDSVSDILKMPFMEDFNKHKEQTCNQAQSKNPVCLRSSRAAWKCFPNVKITVCLIGSERLAKLKRLCLEETGWYVVHVVHREYSVHFIYLFIYFWSDDVRRTPAQWALSVPESDTSVSRRRAVLYERDGE